VTVIVIVTVVSHRLFLRNQEIRSGPAARSL